MHVFNTDTAGSIGSQHWRLLLVLSVYVVRVQKNFYHLGW